MVQRYDLLAVRKYTDRNGEEKAAFTKVGAAFPAKSGNGFSLTFFCVPAPDKESGEYRLLMREPLEEGDRQGGGRQQGNGQRSNGGNRSNGGGPRDSFGDDDIPF